jgi:hypothetical protein
MFGEPLIAHPAACARVHTTWHPHSANDHNHAHTMTAPTISSIWLSTWRHHGYRTNCIDWTCSALFSIAQHDLRGACSSASRLCSEAHACVALRCACALENSAVQRRSVHLQHATRIRGTPMTNQTAVIPVGEAEIRWRNWQARGAANDRRTATRMRTLVLLIVAALAVWFLVQLA